MQQFEREYLAERKAQIQEIYRLRVRIWQTLIIGVPISLSMLGLRLYLDSTYNYNLDDKLDIFGPIPITARQLLVFSDVLLLVSLVLTTLIAFRLSLRYITQRGIYHAIQLEYTKLRWHSNSHQEIIRRSGYENEVLWREDDDEFLDDVSLDEQIHQRTYSND